MVEYTLSSLNPPTGGDTTAHFLRYRVRVDQLVGGTMTLVTELRQGASALSTPASFSDDITSTTETTIEQTLTSGQAGSITNYGALRIRHTATQAANTSAPTFVANGTGAFTATNGATFAPGLPSGWAENDIHILLAARSDNTAMSSLAGWTNIAALTSNNTTAHRVEVWWRRAVAGDTAPTVTFGSGTVVRGGFIIGVRNALASGDPFDTGTGAPTLSANAASATVTFTDITTTTNNCLVIAAGAYEDDPTTITTMTNYTQPAGTVHGSTLGNDMMLFMEYRALATAGAAGAGTITVSGGTFANSVNEGLVMALLPATNNSKARVTWAELEVPQGTAAATFAPPPFRHPYRFFRRRRR
jgi:hypothetical protein